MKSLALAALYTLLAVGPAIAANAGDSPRPDAQIEADCRRYFGGACSEAMGRWLPARDLAWQHRDTAARLAAGDDFAYTPRGAAAKYPGVPADGTAFVYGDGGPPRGAAVYDASHRIAFYHQGCCSWHETMLASGVAAPPKTVVARNLASMRTVRGIALDQTAADVIRLNGRTHAYAVDHEPGVTVLPYAWNVKGGCGNDEDVYLRNGHVIAIQLGWAC